MERHKYPRTSHCPWSKVVTDDDKFVKDMNSFENAYVVVTEKMDGENTTIYKDGYTHARSTTGRVHPSQHKLKNWVTNWCWKIKDTYRICGESLTTQHTLNYKDLKDIFLMFSVWEKDQCLSWEDTLKVSQELGINTVNVIYEGIYDKEKITNNYEKYRQGKECEGYVIRKRDMFNAKDFKSNVVKYVERKLEGSNNW